MTPFKNALINDCPSEQSCPLFHWEEPSAFSLLTLFLLSQIEYSKSAVLNTISFGSSPSPLQFVYLKWTRSQPGHLLLSLGKSLSCHGWILPFQASPCFFSYQSWFYLLFAWYLLTIFHSSPFLSEASTSKLLIQSICPLLVFECFNFYFFQSSDRKIPRKLPTFLTLSSTKDNTAMTSPSIDSVLALWLVFFPSNQWENPQVPWVVSIILPFWHLKYLFSLCIFQICFWRHDILFRCFHTELSTFAFLPDESHWPHQILSSTHHIFSEERHSPRY